MSDGDRANAVRLQEERDTALYAAKNAREAHLAVCGELLQARAQVERLRSAVECVVEHLRSKRCLDAGQLGFFIGEFAAALAPDSPIPGKLGRAEDVRTPTETEAAGSRRATESLFTPAEKPTGGGE